MRRAEDPKTDAGRLQLLWGGKVGLDRTVHDLYFEPLRFAKRRGPNAGCIVTRSLPLTGPVS
jgi:hypothetical protein